MISPSIRFLLFTAIILIFTTSCHFTNYKPMALVPHNTLHFDTSSQYRMEAGVGTTYVYSHNGYSITDNQAIYLDLYGSAYRYGLDLGYGLHAGNPGKKSNAFTAIKLYLGNYTCNYSGTGQTWYVFTPDSYEEKVWASYNRFMIQASFNARKRNFLYGFSLKGGYNYFSSVHYEYRHHPYQGTSNPDTDEIITLNRRNFLLPSIEPCINLGIAAKKVSVQFRFTCNLTPQIEGGFLQDVNGQSHPENILASRYFVFSVGLSSNSAKEILNYRSSKKKKK